MRVEVLRGLDEIGGNVIEVEAGDTRILLDAGAELPGVDSEHSHPIDFDALLAERRYDAVLITHYHGDHLGLLEEATGKLPPVYMGDLAYRLYDIACAYRDVESPFALSGHFEDCVPLSIGELTVTPIFCDHSAADSYSLIVEDGEETLLYTGDYRSHGRKNFKSYLSKLPEHVDTLLIEGTTTSRGSSRSITERELERHMVEIMRECSNQVFVLFSALNVDRVTTVYKAARRSGRTMLMDPYLAAVTKECGERGARIPSPSSRGAGVFLSKGVAPHEHERLRELYGNKLIGMRQYAKQPFVMGVRSSVAMLSLMQKLDGIRSLEGSMLIYSMWEGYKTSPSMARFIAGAKGLGIEVVSAHTSGHADETALRAVIDRTDPRRIVPVHTEHAEWFAKNYPERDCGGNPGPERDRRGARQWQ